MEEENRRPEASENPDLMEEMIGDESVDKGQLGDILYDSEQPEDNNTSLSPDDDHSRQQFSRVLYACHLGNKETLERALRGRHATEESVYVEEGLLLCSSLGHLECLQTLVASTDYVSDVRDIDGNTPVILASINKHYNVLEVLLLAGYDPDCLNNLGDAAIHLAANPSDVRAMAILIQAGSDLNIRNASFSTPLMMASESGNDEVVKMLLEAGCKADITKFSGRSAFHRACERGMLACVQAFLHHGTDVNASDSEGRTALHMAADQGHDDIVKVLLKAGCSANTRDNDDKTPVFECSQRGHIECVKTLIAAGGLTGIKDKYGNTPITSAAILGHVNVLQLLLRMVGDVNVRGYKKLTALHCAALRGHVDCIRVLLPAGAEPNSSAYDGATPIHLALKSNHPFNVQLSILKCFLDYNADFEKKMSVKFGVKRRKLSSFALALAFSHLRIACYLAAIGCDLELVRTWLTRNEWPPDVSKPKPDNNIAWLVEYASDVRTLSEMCRVTLRRHLGCGKISDKVTQLTLPPLLQNFLLYSDLEFSTFGNRARESLGRKTSQVAS